MPLSCSIFPLNFQSFNYYVKILDDDDFGVDFVQMRDRYLFLFFYI